MMVEKGGMFKDDQSDKDTLLRGTLEGQMLERSNEHEHDSYCSHGFTNIQNQEFATQTKIFTHLPGEISEIDKQGIFKQNTKGTTKGQTQTYSTHYKLTGMDTLKKKLEMKRIYLC